MPMVDEWKKFQSPNGLKHGKSDQKYGCLKL